jgi:hypothetical protein
MAMHHPTAVSPLSSITRQRLTLLLLVAISLISTTIAVIALQRQPGVPLASPPVPGVQVPAPSLPAPVRERTATMIDAYEQLQVQRLAAEQAVRAGNTENYEIAVAGAQALQSRIASLQARQQTAEHLDRAIIDAHEQQQLQRLAAEQALRARNTEGYEIAVSGAAALQGRIARLQAERPRD